MLRFFVGRFIGSRLICKFLITKIGLARLTAQRVVCVRLDASLRGVVLGEYVPASWQTA